MCARELTLKEERGAMKKKIWLPLVLTLLLVGCGGEGEVAAPLPPERANRMAWKGFTPCFFAVPV